MTDYSLWQAAGLTPAAVSSGTNFTFSLAFSVSATGLVFKGWYHFIASGQNTAAEDFALWTESGNGTGAYITGSKVTAGPFTAGWNFIPANTPVALTSGQVYRAVRSVTGGGSPFCSVAGYFTSGNGGGAGISSGPLLAYSDATTGGTNKEPNSGARQMANSSGATDVTTQGLGTGGSSSWYGMDILVGDAAPPASSSGLLLAMFP